MTDEVFRKLKKAFEAARSEYELTAATFDAAAAHDNTRRHAHAYDTAARQLKDAVARLKAARAAIEAAIEGTHERI